MAKVAIGRFVISSRVNKTVHNACGEEDTVRHDSQHPSLSNRNARATSEGPTQFLFLKGDCVVGDKFHELSLKLWPLSLTAKGGPARWLVVPVSVVMIAFAWWLIR